MEPSADATDAENCENIAENSTPGRSALLQVTPRLSRATKKATTGSAKSVRWNMEPSADANDAENCENIAENSTPGRSALLQVTPRRSTRRFRQTIDSLANVTGCEMYTSACSPNGMQTDQTTLTKTSAQITSCSFYSLGMYYSCLLYTSPSPRDGLLSRMPS